MKDRFDRSVRFFGREGQERIGEKTLAVIGAGGLGTHVVQQGALFGFGRFFIVDKETLDGTNLNRYVGVTGHDIGQPKADLAARLVRTLHPTSTVLPVIAPLQSTEAFDVIREADIVIGCLDTDGARLVLTESAAAAGKPYLDLASDILTDGTIRYGGRMVFSFIGQGCLVCRGVLDVNQARLELDPVGAAAYQAIYGVPKSDLRAAGPSVVSINGVVASLGMTELMLHVTGVRRACAELTYRGELGKVLASTDAGRPDCYFCSAIFAKWDSARVERYLHAKEEVSSE